MRKRSIVSRLFAAATWVVLIGAALTFVVRRGSNSQQAKD